ncbi:hypothetical protein [Pseudomonas chlororaphis]|uniref:hypothetical protein n=1 Tax=Pseudomonas chlororaphis TaxID=587753 RepID=UPI002365EF9B|nr:hypothetical protein [Pseudomonas chlororaphis]WDH25599.1 hypothetical protein PUP50_15400 [Pseudomonas chlororaphis]
MHNLGAPDFPEAARMSAFGLGGCIDRLNPQPGADLGMMCCTRHHPDYKCEKAMEPNSTPDPDETTGQLMARREAMQAEAASLLGQMLFAFSSIDVNLGLCLACLDNGTKLETLSKSIEGRKIHTKLKTLSTRVAERLPADSKHRAAYKCWIERVHAARLRRNQMVHGRWGVEAHRHKVVNVIGLPSGTQKCVEYSLAELAAFNKELYALERELARLRAHCPL